MRRMVAGALAFLIAAGLTVGWYVMRDATGPLPSTDPAAVAAMVIEDGRRSGWPRYTVDPADYARMLQLIAGAVPDQKLSTFRPGATRAHGPAVPDRTPASWLPLGRVIIDYRIGPPRVVTLFQTGCGQGAFQVTSGLDRHAYYRGASDEEIAATLTRCLQRAQPAK